MPRLILESEGHANKSSTNATKLYENAIADVRVKVNNLEGNQYVLIIDEAQLLNGGDWQQLVCFHNALEQKNIRMTTVSLAQPSILHRRAAFQASDDEQIIARFLSQPIQFRGCEREEDLLHFLNAFDINSEYPEGTDCSFTRFFFPVAFERGFRLAKYGRELWRAFNNAVGTKGNGGISIELICQTIEQLLLALRVQDCPSLIISDDDIDAAVSSSNFHAYKDTSESVDI